MPKIYEMPRMSDTMEEGTLIKWNVKVGDKVKSGDEIADIETDKATMPMPVYDDGVIAKLAVEPGQTLKIGQPLMVLAVDGESVEEAAKAISGAAGAKPAAAAPAPAKPAAMAAYGADSSGGKAATAVAEPEDDNASVGVGGQRVSPLARKLAEEHGLDVAKIKGSGPEGRVIKRDILAAAAAPAAPAAPAPSPAPAASGAKSAPAPMPAAKLESKLVPVSNMRKTIARRLVESKTTIPHFTVTVSVNMEPLAALRTTLNEQLVSQGVKLSVNDFIVRASALALARHPALNSSWTDAGIQQHGQVNIGVAVALPADKGGGLVVPTLRDALKMGLRTISADTRALADKARTKGLTVEEMSDGTFTISNLGMLGVDHFEAIINPPQAAILAVGAAVAKPVVRDGKIVPGLEMTCTLSADHRVVDGAMAAEFLQTLRQMLENPAVLLV
ncbi:MAG: dihydrolipoamide acetyltransferase family protein [Planctomycetota bacterium]|nr:dihydrolipoamide acetyltransferase family protein [Planctomycetota bacterium]